MEQVAALGKGGTWSQSGRRGRRLACGDELAAMLHLRLVQGAVSRSGVRVCLLLGGAYCECSTPRRFADGRPVVFKDFLVRREVMGMGWWQTVSGAVIGDPAADYVDDLIAQGMAYVDPSELPPSVRKRLTSIYVEGLGREPTDEDLRAVLAFCL